MGAIPPPRPPSGVIDLGANVSPETVASIRRLWAIYGVAGSFLRVLGHGPVFTPAVELGQRMWADRHLEALGWAFIGAVVVLVAVLVPK